MRQNQYKFLLIVRVRLRDRMRDLEFLHVVALACVLVLGNVRRGHACLFNARYCEHMYICFCFHHCRLSASTRTTEITARTWLVFAFQKVLVGVGR